MRIKRINKVSYDVSNPGVIVRGCDTSVTDAIILAEVDSLPVTKIGDNAFYYNLSLSSVTIPEGITSIGDFAFFHCSKLKKIVIPESVTKIGEYAFLECSDLTEVEILNPECRLAPTAFEKCNKLV